MTVFNSIIKNLDEINNFVTLSLIVTNTNTPESLRKKIQNKYNFAKVVFNDSDRDLSFEEFFDKYKNLIIDFSESPEFIEEEYIYEMPFFRASKENPREMYLFLKERGLDISNETFKSYMFEDPMAWGYTDVEEIIDDPDGYHPWIKELFNVSENINESLLKEYIKYLL